jgi:hypothetical protein
MDLPHAAIILAALGVGMYSASAEEIILTTYYPSPRGVYHELRTIGKTVLAQYPGANVGIGAEAPGEKLEVNGGVRLNPDPLSAVKPLCSEQKRGTLWFERNVEVGATRVDQLQLCALVQDQYRWVSLAGAVDE